jgi:hypothetical protein
MLSLFSVAFAIAIPLAFGCLLVRFFLYHVFERKRSAEARDKTYSYNQKPLTQAEPKFLEWSDGELNFSRDCLWMNAVIAVQLIIDKCMKDTRNTMEGPVPHWNMLNTKTTLLAPLEKTMQGIMEKNPHERNPVRLAAFWIQEFATEEKIRKISNAVK